MEGRPKMKPTNTKGNTKRIPDQQINSLSYLSWIMPAEILPAIQIQCLENLEYNHP